ncbi:MAG: hypothetical protein ACD_8C00068G0003 [uncultured bacterium]|nr:MAG: hypothetical protein ACD_8C00068G0003 [uncultured bacterium]
MLNQCVPYFVLAYFVVIMLVFMFMVFSQKIGAGVVMEIYEQESFSSIQLTYVVIICDEQSQENDKYIISESMRSKIKRGEEIVFKSRLGRITYLFGKDAPESLLEAVSA